MPKVVDLGRCNTCGRRVDAVVDWTNFIDIDGSDLEVVRVEGHCGTPGHNVYVAYVSRDEYRELPDYVPDTTVYW